MSFHVVSVICPRNDFSRRQMELDAETEEVARYYHALLLTSMGDLSVNFKDVKIKGCVMEHHEDMAIMNLEVGNRLGMGTLVLGGKKEGSRREQKYCIKFMSRLAKTFRLPIPPLEIMPRPLFYYVLFRLGDDQGSEWYDLVENVVQKANGLGIAFLKLRGGRV